MLTLGRVQMLTWMLSWNGFLDACPAAVQEPDNSAYSPLLVAFDRLGRFDRFGRGDDGDLEGK